MKQILTSMRTRLLLLMVFTTGGIFGFIYEILFYRIDLGHFVKRGVTFGPWIPIYGFGAVLVILTTSHLKSRPGAVFLISAFVMPIFCIMAKRLWSSYPSDICL